MCSEKRGSGAPWAPSSGAWGTWCTGKRCRGGPVPRETGLGGPRARTNGVGGTPAPRETGLRTLCPEKRGWGGPRAPRNGAGGHSTQRNGTGVPVPREAGLGGTAPRETGLGALCPEKQGWGPAGGLQWGGRGAPFSRAGGILCTVAGVLLAVGTKKRGWEHPVYWGQGAAGCGVQRGWGDPLHPKPGLECCWRRALQQGVKDPFVCSAVWPGGPPALRDGVGVPLPGTHRAKGTPRPMKWGGAAGVQRHACRRAKPGVSGAGWERGCLSEDQFCTSSSGLCCL